MGSILVLDNFSTQQTVKNPFSARIPTNYNEQINSDVATEKNEDFPFSMEF